jgi:hypothetical protein
MKLIQYSKGFLVTILLAALFSCNKPDSKKYLGTALDPLTDPAKVDTTKYNSEYLLYSTVKINGVLPLKSKFADFFKVVGKPDSLTNSNAQTDCQYYEEPFQYVYFQGNRFILVKDTAIFQNIDFRRRADLELKTPAITLNARTTLPEIKKLFPKAVSKIRTVDSPDRANLRLVDIGASKEFSDEWWILFFEGEKLVSVEMYGPC